MKRKDFLYGSIPAAAMLPDLINGYSIKAFNSQSPLVQALMRGNTLTDHVLVIVQLSGGNDGLNMVIPVADYSKYYNARTNVAIPENRVLPISGVTGTGLHPSMTGLQGLFADGKAKLIQAVGYPQPNFSHFRATDIWMSGSDSRQVLNTGWLGRFLDEMYPGFPIGYPNSTMTDPLAIQIGSVTSLTLQGAAQPMGMSISNPSSFYSFVNNQIDPAPNSYAGKELSFVREMSKQTQKFGEVIKAANAKVTTQSPYPTSNSLADQLKIVARLIKGGLKTKIYMVNYGGFDTHSNQTVAGDTSIGYHATLLGNVSNAIKAFMDDLKFQGVEERVVGMTYSEFGRRILSNGSTGTDHGAAAPLFVFGAMVQAGVSGTTPILPIKATVGDNVPYQYDFRSIYASILSNWLCVNDTTLNNVMLKNFQKLPLTKLGTCSILNPVGNPDQLIVVYPNPFHKKVTIQFKSAGGHTMIQVMDSAGRLVKILIDANFEAGTFRVDFDGEHLPAGLYYIRLQNQVIQQVKSVIKI
jgi:uncharacterized protein (DUF1501 family)